MLFHLHHILVNSDVSEYIFTLIQNFNQAQT